MKKLTILLLGLCAVSAVLLGTAYLTGLVKPDRPQLTSRPLALPPLESSVDVPVSVSLDRLLAMLEEHAPKTISGVESPNVPGNVDQERLDWSASRGRLEISPASGGITVGTTVTGRATLRARFCPGGEMLPCKDFRETADLGARVSISLTDIRLGRDWKLKATLTPNISLTQAESRLFGFIKMSFRSELSAGINAAIPKVQSAFDNFLDKLDVRQQVERAWAAADHIIPVADTPPVWMVVEPIGIAVAPVQVAEGQLSSTLRLVAKVKTMLGERPDDNKASIPSDMLELPDAPTSFALQVPVILPLPTVAGEVRSCCLPLVIPTGSSTVTVSDIALSEGDGKLVIEAAFSSGWLRSHGKVYLEGVPVLSADGHFLSVHDLDFSVDTRERLADGVAELLKPVVLEKFADAIRIDLRPHYEDGLKQARGRLANLSLGQGINVSTDLRSVGVEHLLLGDGAVGVVAVARGSVSVSLP